MFELLALMAAVALSFGTDALRTALSADVGTVVDLVFFEIAGLGFLLLLVFLRRRLG